MIEDLVKRDFAQIVVALWNDYTHSKEGREAKVPEGLPVFNATNFIYWLVEKYKNGK